MDVVVAHNQSPFITAYPWSSGFGTKYADPSIGIIDDGRGVDFSPDGNDIVVGYTSSPYISAYPWSSGFGTKYADPSIMIPDTGRTVVFSPAPLPPPVFDIWGDPLLILFF